MHPAKIALLIVAFAPDLAHSATPNMRDGMWEIITKLEMASESGVAMPQQTVRRCITKKDLGDPRRTTPGAADPDSRCRMSDYKLRGDSASWKMACEGPGAMTGSGTVTYSGESYKGSQAMVMTQGGRPMNLKMDFSGRRVGDCPKD